jgi:hypothetical protein
MSMYFSAASSLNSPFALIASFPPVFPTSPTEGRSDIYMWLGNRLDQKMRRFQAKKVRFFVLGLISMQLWCPQSILSPQASTSNGGKGVKAIRHSPYSPDYAPSDFFLCVTELSRSWLASHCSRKTSRPAVAGSFGPSAKLILLRPLGGGWTAAKSMFVRFVVTRPKIILKQLSFKMICIMYNYFALRIWFWSRLVHARTWKYAGK